MVDLRITHSYEKHFLFAAWSVIIGVSILYFILKCLYALVMTQRVPLQQQCVPLFVGGSLEKLERHVALP